MNEKLHWENVYRSKAPTDVSWYQAQPTVSLDLIARSSISPTDPIIDVGGGASVLAERLLDAGFADVAVLDISQAALDHARTRLGPRADRVTWYEADVRDFAPPGSFALWHDRAVFHFLTDPAARARYRETILRSMRPGGKVVIATFAPDGPARCSGLDVMRHDARSISEALGDDFALLDETREHHRTPWDTDQHFAYFRFERKTRGVS